jgi:hypothetical protein
VAAISAALVGRDRRARRIFLNHGVGLVVAADAPLVSTFVALITYVTVTVEPTLSSADPLIIAGSIANSYFSPPFSTANVVPVAATIVPVISYVFPAAANTDVLIASIIAASKQIIFEFISWR